MKKFYRLLLIGLGIVIGLFIAPRRGEDTRRIVGERLSSFSKNEDQKGTRSETAGNLHNVADTAMHSKRASTVTGTKFEPAYPEFVDPEKKSTI